ncbi:MAG: adenylate/guanylate cyclase domain-containing protein [Coleofasciculaceae cyanobacterium]
MNSNQAEELKGNILVVDDIPDNLRLISSMLTEQGYKVRKVINGPMALRTARISPPDLILLDINMPDMDGYQVCQRLKTCEQTREIPVIFISAFNESWDRVKAFQVGGVDYISKPFNWEEVLVRINNQLTLRQLQKQLKEQNALLQKELQEHQQAEETIRLLLTITQAISQAPDFQTALAVMLSKVCEVTGWHYGEAWTVTADGTALQCSPSWYCKRRGMDQEVIAAFEELRQYSEALIFLPDDELPGRVWRKGEPEWLADLTNEPNDIFLRVQLARNCGLKAGFSVPIVVPPTLVAQPQEQGQVLAVLVFYMLESRPQDARSVELVSAVAAQLGAVMQQKQAAAELRALFAAMNDVVSVLDAQGCYLKIAPTNPSKLYKPEKELIGKSLYEVFERSQAETFLHHIRQSLKSKQKVDFEYYLTIEGQKVWFYSTVSPISDDAVLWVARDVTDRKLAEEAFAEKERYLRLVLNNIPQQVFWKDTNSVFLGCNKNWAEAAGLESPEAVVGLTDYELLPSREIADLYRAQDRKVMETNEQDLHLIETKQKLPPGGKKVWLDINRIPIHDSKGQVIGILGVLEDITLRKQAEEALQIEQEKSDRLLLNILPRPIAQKLKQDQDSLAEHFGEVTILFADIVGFTPFSARVNALELVSLLNQIFSTFDQLTDQHGLEKIKTIGDSYMVAGGLPVEKPDHCRAIAQMALDMQKAIGRFKADNGEPFQLRIGINTGPVVAGVIGIRKFSYDLWGDTVNVASRMEATALPGTIQVTADSYERLKDNFLLEKRGAISVKGKGEMLTYWLKGLGEAGGDGEDTETRG